MGTGQRVQILRGRAPRTALSGGAVYAGENRACDHRCCIGRGGRHPQGSPTYGKHVAVELSAENKRQLYIPRGFAHGFAVLSDEAVFAYKCDNVYMPSAERGIMFNDRTSLSTGA